MLIISINFLEDQSLLLASKISGTTWVWTQVCSELVVLGQDLFYLIFNLLDLLLVSNAMLDKFMS